MVMVMVMYDHEDDDDDEDGGGGDGGDGPAPRMLDPIRAFRSSEIFLSSWRFFISMRYRS